MSEALRELAAVQVAIEDTAGTAAAADMALLGTSMFVEETIDRRVLEEPRGVLADYETADVGKASRLPYQGYLDYEQVLLPLLCGLDGGVQPVDQDSGGPYLWSFDPGLTAAEALKAFTCEWIEDDGSTEHVERKAAFFNVSDFEITIPLADLATITWNADGRAGAAATVTAGQSPVARTLIPGELFGVSIDDSGANLGNSEFPGHIRQAVLSVNTGVTPKRSLKARSSLDKTGNNRNKITGTLMLRMELDANAGDSGEMGDWRSGTKRFVQLSATDGTKVFEANVCIKVVERPVITEEEGVRIVEFTGQIFYDETWGKAITFNITNSLAAFSGIEEAE